MANSFRTRGVSDELVRDSGDVSVVEGPETLELRPRVVRDQSALIFICGAGVHPHAYAPLLRPIADAGYAVFIVRLPYRFAPLASHKDEAVRRARAVAASHPEVPRWVIAGHSLGGAMVARVARADTALPAAYALIGTTHPREDDLSTLEAPFTKVYATNDGVAPAAKVAANKGLLPDHTRYVEIDGGNHSQFGHYGHQLFDGTAMIGREEQQAKTRDVLLGLLVGE